MGYWKDVGEVLKRGINLAAHEVKEGTETLFEKGREEISQLQHKREFQEKHKELELLLAELGDLTHTLYHEKKDIMKNKDFLNMMQQVDKCEKECKEIESHIHKAAA